LIALDCRGHGKSDKPHDPAQYGVEMAADVVRLLDHLKLEKAHLIGYSSGAYLTGKVAATHPDRVLSAVYAGQAPIIGEPQAGDFSECETFAQAVEKREGLGTYIIAVTPSGRPKPTEQQANAIAAFMFQGKDVDALALAGNSFKDLAVTAEELKMCEAPILFIHGGNESNHVKTKVARARELLGRGEVTVVEGGDHMTTLVKPEFGNTVREFLKANKAY
jgi:pimeloyl-ACP methyl ester carboxylesterase